MPFDPRTPHVDEEPDSDIEKPLSLRRKSTTAASRRTVLSDIEKGDPANEAKDGSREEDDPNLVTWDGPDDPANPKNWSTRHRWTITGLVSLLTFMTPIASAMIAPAVDYIDRDLGFHKTIENSLVFSIFLLSFVVGPLLFAPLSELYGRMIVLQLANVFFLIFNLVCGFAESLGEMLVFRILAGFGACAPQTVGGGVLSDLWTADERGQAVAVYSLAPILGPTIGPIMGAWIAEKSTWRWSFWSVTIFGACVQVLLFFTLKETFAPRILHDKAKRLRKETGNQLLHTKFEGKTVQAALREALVRVVVLLATQPIIQFLALYIALNYGIIYLLLAAFPSVWTGIYHESTGIAGLNYISLMIGMTTGAQLSGWSIDFTYKRLKARSADGKGRPEFRVPVLWLSTFLLASGLFMFGWSAEAHTHWIVPNIGAAIFGAGSSIVITALQSYTIDAYPFFAASAVGATAVSRAVTGFSFPLFAPYMYDRLGQGFGNTVLGCLILVIGYSGSVGLWFFGARLRAASTYASGER